MSASRDSLCLKKTNWYSLMPAPLPISLVRLASWIAPGTKHCARGQQGLRSGAITLPRRVSPAGSGGSRYAAAYTRFR